MQQNIEELSRLYRVEGTEFEEYTKKVLFTLTAGKMPSGDKTLIIVGGQSGAGKSRLVPIAYRELQNNAIIVDFDELRSLHPYYQEVSKKYPEITHRILHPDTEKVKNEVLKLLIESGYNVIYEGALRNTQGFIDFAKDFKDNGYIVKMYIMAVPKLESYGSTFVRYALAFLTNATPRWVEKSAHDGAYEGVPRTVEAFIQQKMTDDVHVFVRGNDEPKKIYSTEGRQHRNALGAIENGREMGRRQAVTDFPAKYNSVKAILQENQPEFVGKLDDWKVLYENEVGYFSKLDRGSEYND